MINDLPTIFEVVSGAAKKNQTEKFAVANHSSAKSKSNSKVVKMDFNTFLCACYYFHVDQKVTGHLG